MAFHALLLVFFFSLLIPGLTFTSDPPNRVMSAWTCHGNSQISLVANLQKAKIITSSTVAKVMSLVDRRNYIENNPYFDAPQILGKGQTISAPHMHAHALELIIPHLSKNSDVNLLDVGCGSGYLTACFGRWIESFNGGVGSVYGVDILPELVEKTRLNMKAEDHDLLKNGIATLSNGNGWMGWEMDPSLRMDAIHVGAAASALPTSLATSLKVGGIMVIPIGEEGDIQYLQRIERIAEQNGDCRVYRTSDYESSRIMSVRYVPLVKNGSDSLQP